MARRTKGDLCVITRDDGKVKTEVPRSMLSFAQEETNEGNSGVLLVVRLLAALWVVPTLQSCAGWQ